MSTGPMALYHATVTGNATSGLGAEGGGVYTENGIFLGNSLILGNVTSYRGEGMDNIGTSFGASIRAYGGNIVGDESTSETTMPTTAVFSIAGINTQTAVRAEQIFAQTQSVNGTIAGVLADNGGPVPTVDLLADVNNIAIDGGRDPAELPVDGTGQPRLVDAPGIANYGTYVADIGALELQASAFEARSLVVTTNRDVTDPFDGLTSLREAVAYADDLSGSNTITFDSTVFTGGADSLIRLRQGEIVITDQTVDPRSSWRPDRDQRGRQRQRPAHRRHLHYGCVCQWRGAFVGQQPSSFATTALSRHPAMLSASTISSLTGGRTTDDNEGGAAFLRGSTPTAVSFTRAVVSGNSTLGDTSLGGAVFSEAVTFVDSTVTGNVTFGAQSDGGAVATTLSTTITGSTLTGNAALDATAFGGAIASGNDNGGISNSIVVGNDAGGGTAFDDDTYTAIRVPIPSPGSLDGGDATSVFASTALARPGGTIQAGVLADNGGNLPTVALLEDASNPALDAADTVPTSATDSRGFDRSDIVGIANAATFSDLGSYEVQYEGSLVVTTALDIVDPFDDVNSLREALGYARLLNDDVTITFDPLVFEGGAASVIRLTEGTIEIDDSVTIDASGAADVVISGDRLGNDTTFDGTFITDVLTGRADQPTSLQRQCAAVRYCRK